MPRQPPVAPSPHRFLAGKQKSPSPTKESKPASDLRKEVAHSTAPSKRNAPQQLPSSQFAPTPRFSSAKPKPRPQDQRSPSPPKPATIQSFRAIARPSDAVEEANYENEDDEMLDGEYASAIPTTEHDGNLEHLDQPWTNDVAFSPKRRRLDDSEALISPSRPTFKHPQTPASEIPRQTPQFIQANQQSTQSTTYSASASAQRPTFLRPTAEPQETNEPLPDTFSPHKRGQKFVAGGMAATVQQWIIEAGQTAVRSRRGQGYLKGEEYVMRVKVEDFAGDGPFTANARMPSGDAVNLMLASGLQTNATHANELSKGCVVGIRAPTWEIELNGKVWTVGVDWKVMS